MSYARWSSDDFTSDVYVYRHVEGGWRTHVATTRHAPTEPLPPLADPARHAAVLALMLRSPLVDIGLRHDGVTFTDTTPIECASTLLMLRDAGYRVPQSAIDRLLNEARKGNGDA